MKISVCIPNYNYERYIGATLQSVVEQDWSELEIVISDNASTDRSLEVIAGFGDPRIRVHRNRCNVGFSRNLDRAAELATGDLMLMLSSDDLVRPAAMPTYGRMAQALGSSFHRSMFSAQMEIIDSDGKTIGQTPQDAELWDGAVEDVRLSAIAGATVLRMPAGELLRRCLRTLRTPSSFCSTAYPRALYDATEGYGGNRLVNPDKWFHWKLLTLCDAAYYVQAPLFAYRWHAANQRAQEMGTGALKKMVDEYVSTLEIDSDMLARAGMTREQVVSAFIEHDVARHGLATLARGNRMRANRIFGFGASVYPEQIKQNGKAWALRALLHLGPVGQKLAAAAYARRPKSDSFDENEV